MLSVDQITLGIERAMVGLAATNSASQLNYHCNQLQVKAAPRNVTKTVIFILYNAT